jgi:hypothetical protein
MTPNRTLSTPSNTEHARIPFFADEMPTPAPSTTRAVKATKPPAVGAAHLTPPSSRKRPAPILLNHINKWGKRHHCAAPNERKEEEEDSGESERE